MKKGLSTILVFLNLLVSPWLGCYANAKEDITTKTTISCLENKIDEKNKKGTQVKEKSTVSFSNAPYANQINSKENNVVDVVLDDGKTLRIAMHSDVRIFMPKRNKQLKREVTNTKDKKVNENKDKNTKIFANEDSVSDKIKNFACSAISKFLFATLGILPQYLLVRYL